MAVAMNPSHHAVHVLLLTAWSGSVSGAIAKRTQLLFGDPLPSIDSAEPFHRLPITQWIQRTHHFLSPSSSIRMNSSHELDHFAVVPSADCVDRGMNYIFKLTKLTRPSDNWRAACVYRFISEKTHFACPSVSKLLPMLQYRQPRYLLLDFPQ